MAATKKAKSSNAAANESRRQVLRATIDSVIKAHFSSTLGTQDDIVNIFLALTHLESHFNVNARGPLVSETVSSGARDYWNSTPVKNILANGSAQQKANLIAGKRALGVAQIMGWNVVRGASVKNGKCEVEKHRPDLAGLLCVDAGDDLEAKFLGEQNLVHAVTAGLVILESKWKAVSKTADGWKAGQMVFPLRISGAVAAYLGLGKADVVTGMTPQAYSSSIVGGSHYLAANGASAPNIRDSNVQYASSSAKGPKITVASAQNKKPSGCVSSTA